MQKHNLLNKMLIKIEAIAGKKKRSRVRTVFFEGQNHRNQKTGFFFIYLATLGLGCQLQDLGSLPGGPTQAPCTGGLYHWTAREAPQLLFLSNTSLLVLIFLTTHRADTQRLTAGPARAARLSLRAAPTGGGERTAGRWELLAEVRPGPHR